MSDVKLGYLEMGRSGGGARGGGASGGRGLTSGAVGPDPAWVTLAGTIDRVTGTVVGAQAGLGTRFTKLPSGTHCGHTYSHTGHMGPTTPPPNRSRPHQTGHAQKKHHVFRLML